MKNKCLYCLMLKFCGMESAISKINFPSDYTKLNSRYKARPQNYTSNCIFTMSLNEFTNKNTF